MKARIQIVDASALAQAAAQLIAQLVHESLGSRDRTSLALAGGHTPEPVYRCLAGLGTVAWSRVDIFFGDERAVPPDDDRSNYRMAREMLLERVPIAPSAIYRIEAERPDANRVAAEYAARLPARFDIILLGIGEDGHTASLFPHSPALEERTRMVVATSAPKPPPRITITPPVLAAARETLVIAAGRRKAAAVRRALLEPVSPAECPGCLVRNGRWLLDREAGALLESR